MAWHKAARFFTWAERWFFIWWMVLCFGVSMSAGLIAHPAKYPVAYVLISASPIVTFVVLRKVCRGCPLALARNYCHQKAREAFRERGVPWILG